MDASRSAGGPAAGYIYQGDYALLQLVARLESGGSLSLEIFDDVTFHPEQGGAAREQLQLKHSIGERRSMSDNSVDLWKTIAIWSGQVPSDPEVTARAFSLITVHRVPPESAASLLRPGSESGRDSDKALRALEAIAKCTKQGERLKHCETFMALSPAEREILVSSITVIDDSPNALDLDSELIQKVGLAVPRSQRRPFVEALKGWWARQVLEMYFGNFGRVDTQDVEAKIDELREGFARRDVAPITVDSQSHPGPTADYTGMRFVEQLRLISVAQTRVENAIRDYYRAAAQRSEWERSGAVLPSELSTYQEILIDEWRHYRAILEGEATGDLGVDEALKEQFGRDIYTYCETKELTPRARLSSAAPWLCRGSWHILADGCRVGWHPDFESKLARTGGSVARG